MSVLYDEGHVAMALGNLGLMLVTSVLQLVLQAVVAALTARCHKDVSPLCSAFLPLVDAWFPAISIRVSDFLLPGTFFAAAMCLLSGNGGDVAAGVVGSVMVAVIVVGAQCVFRSRVRPLCSFRRCCPGALFPTGTRVEAALLLPRGKWLPRVTRQRYGPLMNAFVGGCEWARSLVMCLSLLLAFVTAMAASNVGCRTGALVAGVAHFVGGFVLVAAHPYRLRADRILAPFAVSLVGLTCILKSTGSVGLSAASDAMTAAAAVLQIIRVLLSLWVQYREHQWGDRLELMPAVAAGTEVVELRDVPLLEQRAAMNAVAVLSEVNDYDDATEKHDLLEASLLEDFRRVDGAMRDMFDRQWGGVSALQSVDGYFMRAVDSLDAHTLAAQSEWRRMM